MSILKELTDNRQLKLPSLPAIGLKILKSVKKDDFSVGDLTRYISADPALAARTLRMANSALYSPRDKVDTIERAVQILGSESLKNIALSFVIMNGLKKNAQECDFNYDFFWRRAITAAVAAESISQRFNRRAEDIFITTLLMDIGIVVMYLCEPRKYMDVIRTEKKVDTDIIKIERDAFGFDHQEVGREFLRDWQIPENISTPIAYHHAIDSPPGEYRDAVEILKISNIVSSLYNGGLTIERIQTLQTILKSEAGMTIEEVNTFVDEVAEKTIDVLGGFNIDPGDMKPYSEILNEANEELSKMNVSYAQLVIELNRAKDKAELMTTELEEANEHLRQLAFQDQLTALYNHRFFQEQMDKEIDRAERYGQHFSLILFDVDSFKPINDEFGHIHGDKVLATIGEFMLSAVRGSDIAARYGGDEFACLLPNTDIKGAAVFAERLRKRAEEFEIKTTDEAIKFTLSIGAGCYDPDDKTVTKAGFFDSVDKALYTSKEAGRNRVTLLQN